MTEQAKPSPLAQLFGLVVVGVGVYFGYQWVFGGIESQVADDAIKQYEIVKRQGSKMEQCAQAGLVTAALLQAQDEERYAQWKKVEATDCAKAGLR
jgi:hypothetical protein